MNKELRIIGKIWGVILVLGYFGYKTETKELSLTYNKNRTLYSEEKVQFSQNAINNNKSNLSSTNNFYISNLISFSFEEDSNFEISIPFLLTNWLNDTTSFIEFSCIDENGFHYVLGLKKTYYYNFVFREKNIVKQYETDVFFNGVNMNSYPFNNNQFLPPGQWVQLVIRGINDNMQFYINDTFLCANKTKKAKNHNVMIEISTPNEVICNSLNIFELKPSEVKTFKLNKIMYWVSLLFIVISVGLGLILINKE